MLIFLAVRDCILVGELPPILLDRGFMIAKQLLLLDCEVIRFHSAATQP